MAIYFHVGFFFPHKDKTRNTQKVWSFKFLYHMLQSQLIIINHCLFEGMCLSVLLGLEELVLFIG